MIVLLFSTPFLIKVIISLFIILIINRLTKNLQFSVAAGIIVLALWSGRSLQDIALISFHEVISPNTIYLIVILFLVIWLSMLMSENKMIEDLVTNVRARVSNRSAMAALPALIGLLPMPGGAVFSAPLVDSIDEKKELDPLLKVRINYWFRHIWEFWWPLYPAVLLALDITGLSIARFMLFQIPLWIMMMFTGYFFLLRKVNIPGIKHASGFSRHKFLLSVMPVIIVIFIYAICRMFFPFLGEFNKYIPMCIGVFLAVVFAQVYKPLNFSGWKKIVLKKSTLGLVVTVVLVVIYGAFIDSPLPDGSLIMSHMRTELSQWHIPLMLVIMIIPFVSGMVTGIAIAFVGASFPIVLSLLGMNPDPWLLSATTVLAYGFGYLGMILSPVHICLIVTNRHFNTGLEKSIVQLVKPVAFMMVCVLVYYSILNIIYKLVF